MIKEEKQQTVILIQSELTRNELVLGCMRSRERMSEGYCPWLLTRSFAALRMTYSRHSEDVCPKNLVHNNKILRFAQDDEPAEPRQCRSKRVAFTLAEVLITLGIIGIVAAMTIPTLTRAYQKKITETRLEQFYSMMTQAIKLSIADNGQVSEWIERFDRTNPEQRRALNEKYILKYLKGVTHCADIPALTELEGAVREEIINKCGAVKSSYSSIYKLQNGSCITLTPYFSTKSKLYAAVDVNCGEKPNGVKPHDSFGFTLMYDGRFVPQYYSDDLTREDIINGTHINADMWGYPEYTFGCTNKSGIFYSKHLCGALIMLDGWKIKDDYPW